MLWTSLIHKLFTKMRECAPKSIDSVRENLLSHPRLIQNASKINVKQQKERKSERVIFVRLCALKAFKTLDSRGMSDVEVSRDVIDFTKNFFSTTPTSISGIVREKKDKKAAAWENCVDSEVVWGGRTDGVWREREVHGYFMERAGSHFFRFSNSRFLCIFRTLSSLSRLNITHSNVPMLKWK